MADKLFSKEKTVTLSNRYKIVHNQVLGEGSFAIVYKGLDVKECRNVAVKVYKGSDETATDMFTKSIDVLKHLNSNRHGRFHDGEGSHTLNELKTNTSVGASGWSSSGSGQKESPKPQGMGGMLLSPRRILSRSGASSRETSNERDPHSPRGPKDESNPSSPATSPRLVDKDRPLLQHRDSFQGSLLEEDLKSIHSADNKIQSSAVSILSMMDWGRCFVKLLSYSKSAPGKPGLDPESDIYFLVFELGDESLEDRLTECSSEEKTLTVPELRDLQWALVSIVCGLHSEGFVHLDIKPRNIMKFKDPEHSKGGEIVHCWKLIDLDGAMRTGQTVTFDQLVFTPEYVCPELARAHASCAYGATFSQRSASKSSRPDELKLSRLMDIWSVGMCALEAIFLQPVLEPWYQEWRKDTGSDEKYFRWLSDYETDAILSGDMRDAIAGIDSEMCSMLEGMLAKDPAKRACVANCITHKWFEPIRDVITEELRQLHMERLGSLTMNGNSTSQMTSRPSENTPRSFKPVKSSNSVTKAAKQSRKVAKIASSACSVM